ncbi:transcriptional regulator/sugar kinase [Saccharomonospora marina XMU15]|uniref:Transcriptional regulator/sugar kinase n=1 Tax=Saccharomonospora marina XMU15 TaxID=882083 RepID=H5X2Q8_9PSEU|nr:ROK family transcriptional regulator [Saccharomonospora marina]EHR50997.1 transcriptional regulator/sugar kinase [Saccharomonospora marina XMU15]
MTGTGPAGQHTVRRHNCALVLGAVAQSPGISRAGIAARTGLTKATVSSLVDRLLAATLLHDEGPQRRAGPGRRGTSLSLSPHGPHGLGVEIAVDYVATCLVDLTGAVHDLRTRHGDNRDRPVELVLDKVTRAIAAARRAATRRGVAVGGIGVAVPGLVESATGVLRVAPNLDWHGIDLPARLRRRAGPVGRDVIVGNEANLAALAELWAMGEEGPRDFVHVSAEIGIGAGIVLDGELHEGFRGFGGELGHFPVDPRGPRCRCGARGCLERLAGQEAILAAANATGLEELIQRLRDGDRMAQEAVERAAASLGVALSAVVNLLDVPAVVLGGGYARLHRWLADPLLAELRTRVVSAPWSRIEVLPSSLGTEAAVRGAAASVVRTIVADPEAFISG